MSFNTAGESMLPPILNTVPVRYKTHMISKPPMDEMVRFILLTHQVEKLTVDMDDINQALKRTPNPNPYVAGHFDAINYLLSLVDSPDFPAKEPSLLTNVYRSDENLYWLRKLHLMISLPLAQVAHQSKWEDELSQVKKYECGVLRNQPAANAFAMAPQPDIIPHILHLWFVKIAYLHAEVKDELPNPYGITREKSFELAKEANDSLLLFANLQPFTYGSNRLGRLIENALRLKWHLPFKPVEPTELFIKAVQQFGQAKMPPIIEKAKELTKLG